MTKVTETLLQFAAFAVIGHIWGLPSVIVMAILANFIFPIADHFLDKWLAKKFPKGENEHECGYFDSEYCEYCEG